MKLIFAQGNPGKQYERTRHNVGFIVLDELAKQHGASWRADAKLKAHTTEIHIGSEKVLLIKPQTFYNDTGLTARSLVDFYKLTPSSDILVIHDDLALPFGKLRIREQGSDAGNNGIKSLNSHLGPLYSRIRIGIWNERRDLMHDADFVLSAFSQKEATALETIILPKVFHFIDDFTSGNLNATSHTLDITLVDNPAPSTEK